MYPWVQNIIDETLMEGSPERILSPAKKQHVLLVAVSAGNHEASEKHYGRNGWKKLKKPRLVEIVDGQYMGTHGLSNFWYWREVSKTGKLSQKYCGYAEFKKK